MQFLAAPPPPIPIVPAIPLVPALPIVPAIPLVPALPIVPAIPLVPALPIVPAIPLVPAFPTVPAIPLVPAPPLPPAPVPAPPLPAVPLTAVPPWPPVGEMVPAVPVRPPGALRKSSSGPWQEIDQKAAPRPKTTTTRNRFMDILRERSCLSSSVVQRITTTTRARGIGQDTATATGSTGRPSRTPRRASRRAGSKPAA